MKRLYICTVFVIIGVLLYYFFKVDYQEHYISYNAKKVNLPKFPIDAVYTWVDGSDINWKVSRGKYVQRGLSSNNSAARWRDLNTLKYSIRSLQKYAPWIRNIYLVTCRGQIPDWLDTKKVTVIDHDEIIESKYLPTFQSLCIEACLHKIPNLSEHFIYFNDDVLLGREVYPSDFFYVDQNNKIMCKFFREKNPINFEATPFTKLLKQTNDLLNYVQFENNRRMSIHAPYALSKKAAEYKQEQFIEEYDKTKNAKFRKDNLLYDLSLFNSYWCQYNSFGREDKISNLYIRVNDKISKGLKRIKKVEPKTYCINDVEDNVSDETINKLNNFLEDMYPIKSKYEL